MSKGILSFYQSQLGGEIMKFLLRKGSFAINWARHIIFQKWFRKNLTKCIVKRQNQKNLIDSYNLGAHLMKDLGFDRDGNSTQWSTFSKPTHMSHEAHPMKAKRGNSCVNDRDDKQLNLQSRHRLNKIYGIG